MQFGHNDSGPLDDTARARGTIKGVGEDSIEIYKANSQDLYDAQMDSVCGDSIYMPSI